jgi:hypothetical protein
VNTGRRYDSGMSADTVEYTCPLCGWSATFPNQAILRMGVGAHDDIEHGSPMYGGDPNAHVHEFIGGMCIECGYDPKAAGEPGPADPFTI